MLVAQMRASGAPAEVINQVRAAERSREVLVWPENWEAVRAFCALGTQWRIAAGPGGLVYLGIDYAAVAATLDLADIPRSRDLFAALRVMEAAATAELNARAGRRSRAAPRTR